MSQYGGNWGAGSGGYRSGNSYSEVNSSLSGMARGYSPNKSNMGSSMDSSMRSSNDYRQGHSLNRSYDSMDSSYDQNQSQTRGYGASGGYNKSQGYDSASGYGDTGRSVGMQNSASSFDIAVKKERSDDADTIIEKKIAQALEKIVGGAMKQQESSQNMMGGAMAGGNMMSGGSMMGAQNAMMARQGLMMGGANQMMGGANQMMGGVNSMMGRANQMMGGGSLMGSPPALMGGNPMMGGGYSGNQMKRQWSSNQPNDAKRMKMSYSNQANNNNQQQGGRNRRRNRGNQAQPGSQQGNKNNKQGPNVAGMSKADANRKLMAEKYCKICSIYYKDETFDKHRQTTQHKSEERVYQQEQNRQRNNRQAGDGNKKPDTKGSNSREANRKMQNFCRMCKVQFEEENFDTHRVTEAHKVKYEEHIVEVTAKRVKEKIEFEKVKKIADEKKAPLSRYQLCESCECQYNGSYASHIKSNRHRTSLREKGLDKDGKDHKEARGKPFCKYGCGFVQEKSFSLHCDSEAHKDQLKIFNSKKDEAKLEEEKRRKEKEEKKPPGVDQVVEVKGYYCKACLKFYTDENMAKVIHCTSKEHIANLQKKNLLKLHERAWLADGDETKVAESTNTADTKEEQTEEPTTDVTDVTTAGNDQSEEITAGNDQSEECADGNDQSDDGVENQEEADMESEAANEESLEEDAIAENKPADEGEESAINPETEEAACNDEEMIDAEKAVEESEETNGVQLDDVQDCDEVREEDVDPARLEDEPTPAEDSVPNQVVEEPASEEDPARADNSTNDVEDGIEVDDSKMESADGDDAAKKTPTARRTTRRRGKNT